MFALASLAALAALAAPPQTPPPSYVTIEKGDSALRQAFNAAGGKARVVALVAPNCGHCRAGLVTLRDQVLALVGSRRVAVFVAWVPMLPSDSTPPGPDALGLIDGPRARQFWDADHRLTGEFHRLLRLSSRVPAWGLFLIYTPSAWWGNGPPKPAYWAADSGSIDPVPVLDGTLFRKRLQSALAGNNKTRHLRPAGRQ